MRIIYIAHPISGNVDDNVKNLLRIVKMINDEYANVVPFVPYLSDVLAMDDSNPLDRKRGIENNTALIQAGFIHELWLTGDKISFGMMEELNLFKKLGIPITNYVNKF